MKRNEGITLIALVVTIIVLLILAGVSISMLAGDNGIIRQSQRAKQETEQAEQDEREKLDNLNQYIGDMVNGVDSNQDRNAKFENNGIDKTHDGAQYDPITTEDGMWTIYKDIDTKTTKVNVYVESKYYYPSFEQFVLEKCYLVQILSDPALPVYSFSDLSDFYANMMMVQLKESQPDSNIITEDEYMIKRREEMGIGPFFEEILEQAGTDEYDAYKEKGKEIIEKLKGEESSYVSDNSSMLPDVFLPNSSELTYDNLLATYNKLYGDKINLTIPEEEKNKTYKIELPDGKVKEITGENLYKAKFRYVTTKNGDVEIKITKNDETPQKITYDKVNNIDVCIINEGNYTYTYNCLPFLDAGSAYIMMGYLLSSQDDLANLDPSSIDVAAIFDEIEKLTMLYRFNLGGWNVTQSNLVQSLSNAGGIDDPDHLELGELGEAEKSCEQSINGEPITCMVGTYLGRKIIKDNVVNLIPNTVKYMFDTFRESSFSNDITEITLPKSLEYGSYVVVPLQLETFSGDKLMKIRLYENSKSGCLGLCNGRNLDGLISDGLVEIYK